MRTKRAHGQCMICGASTKLTKEHTPPQKANNLQNVTTFDMRDILAGNLRSGRFLQGGMSAHVLCQQCNNDTGTWYANEYVSWARLATDVLGKTASDTTALSLVLNGVHPLRFLKQATTMMFAIADPQQPPPLQNLRDFVLDKHNTQLPIRYKLYLMLYRAGPFRQYSKLSLIRHEVHSSGGQVLKGSGYYHEVAHPPFWVVMTEDSLGPPRFKDWGDVAFRDISEFSQYGYNQRVNLRLTLSVYTATEQEFLPPGPHTVDR